MEPFPLEYRPWLTHVRQELTAPAQNLLDMGHTLEEDSRTGNAPAFFQTDVQAIARNAEELFQRITGILEGGLHTQGQKFEDLTQFERFVRHELRSPANRVIQRCEILVEDMAEELPSLFLGELEAIKTKSWQIIKLIDKVVSFSEAEHSPPPGIKESGIVWVGYDGETTQEKIPPGNILIVDDNEDNREIFLRKLRREGHTVHAVSSGEEALNLLKQNPERFDVILLDVIMPGKNGIQVLKELKSDDVLHHIPVIMISALDALDSVVRCIEMGAEDYLPKTCDPVLLRARIGASLEKKRLRERETELLHAIFPRKLVSEYKKTKSICARRHENVGVLFLDIVGFTNWSDSHSPETVIEFLEKMVTSFEKILESHPVEKIKTIGDAFMCTSGLLSECEHPVRALVQCGEKMVQAAREETSFNVRVGIHVGTVIAGKVGNRQFTFDLWGQTVNLAARMESNGKPGGITLTPDAWATIRNEAEGTPRLIQVKGLKEPMEAWDFLRFR